MGGSESPVGVVPEQGAPAPAVEHRSAPRRTRRYAGFPWDSERMFEVPWSARTYTFDWTDGGIAVLPENWAIDHDKQNRVTGIAKSEVPDANRLGFPELTFEQAKAMKEMSSKKGVSLKVAFAKVVGVTKLSQDVMDKIALAPELFAPPSREEAIAISKKQVADKFWQDVKAKEK